MIDNRCVSIKLVVRTQIWSHISHVWLEELRVLISRSAALGYFLIDLDAISYIVGDELKPEI